MSRDDDASRALALYEEGRLAFRAGNQEASTRLNEEALTLARAAGDANAEALALVGLSRVAFREGDYDRVRMLAEEGLELARDVGEQAEASPLHMLAAATRLSGDYEGAGVLYTRSLELNRRLEADEWVAMECHNLGFVELHRGNVRAAEQLFLEAAKLERDEPYDLAMRDLQQAALAVHRGESAEAADLMGRIDSRLESAGIVLDPDDAFEVGWLREALHKAS